MIQVLVYMIDILQPTLRSTCSAKKKEKNIHPLSFSTKFMMCIGIFIWFYIWLYPCVVYIINTYRVCFLWEKPVCMAVYLCWWCIIKLYVTDFSDNFFFLRFSLWLSLWFSFVKYRNKTIRLQKNWQSHHYHW